MVSSDTIVIYCKDQLTYEYSIDDHYDENKGYVSFSMIQISNSDIVANVGRKLIYISKNGKI